MSKPRKNVKRIDPRYFLHEAKASELSPRDQMGYAIYMVLRDGQNNRPENPLSLSAVFDTQDGMVLRYFDEWGIDPRDAMDHRRAFMSDTSQIRDPFGDVHTFKLATVPRGMPGEGTEGIYLA